MDGTDVPVYNRVEWMQGSAVESSGTFLPILDYQGERMAITLPELRRVQQAVGYAFGNPALLLEALTHPSASAQEPSLPHYQRLEFLGDAVLQFLSSRILYELYPASDEGELTRMRSSCVSEKPLSEAAEAMEFGRYVVLSRGAEKSGARKLPSIACDVYEAVLAAIYLDGGEEPALEYVRRTLGNRFAAPPVETKDAKTRLQETLQKNGPVEIRYEEIGQEGPPHEPVFIMELKVDGRPVTRGRGRSKQAAQRQAAEYALQHYDGKETPDAPQAD